MSVMLLSVTVKGFLKTTALCLKYLHKSKTQHFIASFTGSLDDGWKTEKPWQ